jgi:hypothetical protein
MPKVLPSLSNRGTIRIRARPPTPRQPEIDLDAIEFAETCTRLSSILRRIWQQWANHG